MIWRPQRRHKPWWDSQLCREWEFKKGSARIINGIVPVRAKQRIAQNDRDHIVSW